MKKMLLIIILISMIFIVSCNNKSEKIKDSIKTFDDLKKAKEAGELVSEYDKCIKEVEIEMNAHEKLLRDCQNSKLEELGYTDGVDCIDEFDNPVCDPKRYNVGIYAYNDCVAEQTEEMQNSITILDCNYLL